MKSNVMAEIQYRIHSIFDEVPKITSPVSLESIREGYTRVGVRFDNPETDIFAVYFRLIVFDSDKNELLSYLYGMSLKIKNLDNYKTYMDNSDSAFNFDEKFIRTFLYEIFSTGRGLLTKYISTDIVARIMPIGKVDAIFKNMKEKGFLIAK